MNSYAYENALKEINKNKNFERFKDPVAYNNNIRTSWLPIWCKNTAENFQEIKRIFNEEYIADLNYFPERANKDVIIIGSGPSLNDILPRLKEWKGDIVCSSSQLHTLQSLGIKPTFVVIIDSDPTMNFLVEDYNSKDVPLITHPNIDPFIIKAWKGKKYFFRMHDPEDPLFKDFQPAIFWNLKVDKELKLSWGIRSYVLNSGCIVNTAIAICKFFNYQNIILSGFDLGAPNDQHRFEGKVWNKELKKYQPILNAKVDNISCPVVGSNNIKTDRVSVFYKYSTMVVYGMDNANLLYASRGLLCELPKIEPDELFDREKFNNAVERCKTTPYERYKIAQTYLKLRGVYVRKYKDRIQVVNWDTWNIFRKLVWKIYFELGCKLKRW